MKTQSGSSPSRNAASGSTGRPTELTTGVTRIPSFIRDIIGRTRPRDLPGRLILYAGLWWLITGGDAGAWTWGAPAVAAAAIISPFPGRSPWQISIPGALTFLPVFVVFSLRGALDVARRALHPRRPLNPALLDYPWRLPDNGSRVFLANLINLMPGTLCVRITGRAMTVHTIGNTTRTLSGLAQLEARTAMLLKQPLHDEH